MNYDFTLLYSVGFRFEYVTITLQMTPKLSLKCNQAEFKPGQMHRRKTLKNEFLLSIILELITVMVSSHVYLKSGSYCCLRPTSTKKVEHICPVLRSSHWFSVSQITGSAPKYIIDLSIINYSDLSDILALIYSTYLRTKH